MTGFGAGSAALGPGRLIVEIRALNHKHQEVRIRLPAELHEHLFFTEQKARALLGRGRYDVSVRVEGTLLAMPRLNEERLSALFTSLTALSQRLDPSSKVEISHLLHLPEMFATSGPGQDATQASLVQALGSAHQELVSMRKAEGATLGQELQSRLAVIVTIVRKISEESADLVQHHARKLRERVDQLLGDSVSLNSERLEHEIALIADRSDITEELVRLQSHFSQFEGFLASDEPVGRRLDFLLQEIGREVNTIGSKSAHAPLSHLIVEMKSEVERLREQVQNVA